MTDIPSPDYKELRRSVHTALRAWQRFDNTPENLLADLVLVQEQRQTLSDTSPPNLRLATNQILLAHINELEKHNQQGARILTMRFIDGDIIQKVANKLHLSVDQVKRQQRDAIDSLARLLLANEMTARHTRAQMMEASLTPPTYTALFGVDKLRNTLVNKLLLSGPPWVLAIVGIGGIGKTSLADASVRSVIREFQFEKVIWLRVNTPVVGIDSTLSHLTLDNMMVQLAQQLSPHLPPETPTELRNLQVRQTLKTIPYLIVIDNLELEADSAYLLPLLNDLANPSKFLLTARTHAPGQVGVFSLPLKELSLQDAADLIRHHAQHINFGDLAGASLDELQPIYEVIGGNPLALKLVVGLATVYPLSEVLEDLIVVQSDQVEKLYRHIYWHTWNTLSQNSRALLEIMPMVANIGAVPEQMVAMSGLTKKQLWPAINELVSRSLLEVGGTIQERRYGIHHLTEAFLRTEIIRWPEDTESTV